MTDQQSFSSEDPENDAFNNLLEDRRLFLKQSMAIAGLSFSPVAFLKTSGSDTDEVPVGSGDKIKLSIMVNGTRRRLSIDPRVTLLDLLREQLGLTGTKKGCDLGQCGACTIHVDGQRVLACLSLAVMHHGKKISTVEGLSKGSQLHPLQEAFIKHDGFQCGYCTPGQLMSAVACVREGCAGSAAEIQEYMSGNLCRCGAYPNIVNAILEVQNSGVRL